MKKIANVSKGWEREMQDKLKRVGDKLWKVFLSPHTITAFKVAGLALQALHEIENFRKNHKGHKLGFRMPGDDNE